MTVEREEEGEGKQREKEEKVTTQQNGTVEDHCDDLTSS
jgi:hypothetical protein